MLMCIVLLHRQRSNGASNHNGVVVKEEDATKKRRWGFRNHVKSRLFNEDPVSGSLTRLPATQCREVIRGAINSSWHAYRRYAWGRDELLPLFRQGRDWYGGNRDAVCSSFAFTMVDSLDTLWLAGLHDEFAHAVDWLELHYESRCLANLRRAGLFDERVSSFEVTIRVVGGLISAFELSRRDILLKLAVSVADDVIDASVGPYRKLPIPYTSLRPSTLESALHWIIGDPQVSLVVAGSTHVEFRALAHLTNNSRYKDFADSVEVTLAASCPSAPCPLHWFTNGNPATERVASLGSGGDSYYEYTLKACLQKNAIVTELHECQHWKKVSAAILHGSPLREYEGVHVRFPGGEWTFWFEELSCFAGGLFALSHMMFKASDQSHQHLQFATDVAMLCSRVASELFPLPPERLRIHGLPRAEDEDAASGAWAYHLRPEGFESFYYLWRATGNEEFREAAWFQFASIVQRLQDPSTGAFSAAWDVRTTDAHPDVELLDRMESFWIAETLKYLLLTFSEPSEDVSLDTYIFTTEAHLVRRGGV